MKRWHALLLVAGLIAAQFAMAYIEPCDGHSCSHEVRK
jgi:hypothetical protein